MKKVLNILVDVLIVIVVAFAVLMTIMAVTASKSKSGIPTVFGYGLLSVQTDSMVSPEGFSPGDLIIVHTLEDKQCNELKIGDVVTYQRVYDNEPFLESHRIVPNTPEVNPFYADIANEVVDGVWVHEGYNYYVTMGDNTPGIDFTQTGNKIDYASHENIVGKWTGTKLPGVGKALDFLRTQSGFMLCVVLPVAAFFIYELYVFIMTLNSKQKEKTLAEVADKEAELKQKAIEEFLAQQQKDGGEAAAPETAPAAPVGAATSRPEDEPAKPAEEPTDSPAASSPADISEEEKQRIIQEYLAKQSGEKKE
ncbi:MAG: hypothetical protein IJT44_00840 [Clostridia bacterium]|nr:hypothetical protein [Clostridia bacterium]